jgi:hypothetical protein
MSKNEMQFNLALAEAKQSQLRAEYYAKRIETGSYKERIGKSLNFDKTPRTEQEILQDEVETMYRHIDLAEKHLDMAKHYLANE